MSIASEITRLQGAKADLATAIEGKGVTVPAATKLDGYADLVDAISQGGGGGTMQSKSVSYTPSTSAQSQTVTADDGYDGLSSVAVSVAAMPSGTEGTPTATKGTVSNNSVTVTPSVTNSAGYIEGGTKTGTAVTVSASELVAGYQIKTANGTYDVTNLASLIVQVPNSYSASDEGKVVSNGALVAQTAHADVTPTTSDQTIDTTLNNSLKVKGDTDLVAGNIKKDVEIFGVTGSYEGSGGGDIDALVARTITSYDSDTTIIGVYSFRECTALESVTLSGRVHIYGNAFYGCTSLRSFNAKNCYKIFGNAFHNVPVDALVFPNISNGELGAQCFESWKGTKADLGGTSLEIKLGAFSSASNFNTLILRKNTVVPLTAVNAFSGTPFASGRSGGDIYIPKTLYDALGTGTNDYKSASNWSTVDGYGTITWHAIEGSYYETHYADGTVIS